ncbi:hypothetical protein BN1723_001636 [Verticillium longisporum]|uniref:Amino acid permease/ SLC12A domain-containing protein n=1 Tax=Verticillium longisporum TaxID=100787 RepID=A0A0G4KJQ3_VERLO|nr:hypothetical protein BN1723_001636 [Verticillium longisporum]
MVAMAFAILNTWIALAGSIGLVLPSGGPVSLLYGFVFCVMCNFALTASLGELAAIWPTAGGQYHFVYALCSTKWKRVMSFWVGWTNIVGWLIVVTVQGFFAALFICAASVVASDGRFVVTQWNTYLIFLAILTFATAGNIWGNKILGKWNDLALACDDEFDIETSGGGNYYKRSGGGGIGYIPGRNGSLSLQNLGNQGGGRGSYVSGHHSPNPIRRTSSLSRKTTEEQAGLLGQTPHDSDLESDIDISDLPPPAQRGASRQASPLHIQSSEASSSFLPPDPTPAAAQHHHVTAGSAIRSLFTTEDASQLFRQLDEDFIKPTLLLDGGHGGRSGGHNGGPSGV